MEEQEKEYILEDLQVKKSKKKKLIMTMSVIFLFVIIILGISVYQYFQSPEKTLGIGADIENALLSAEGKIAYVKLTGGSLDKNITKIKFVFTDSDGNEYFYETQEGVQEIEVPYSRSFWDWLLGRQFVGSYDYKINNEDIGIDNFENIKEINVLFEYETETGIIIDSPVLDTGTITQNQATSSGGSPGGGDPGTTTPTPTIPPPECVPKTCSELGKECGNWDNNCSGIIDCGTCTDKICYNGICVEEGVCGNGILETDELCDDGINNGLVGYCNEDCNGLIGDYYVSQLDENCSDDGNGTSEVPWCNLNRSYTWYSGDGPKVGEGDVVLFRDGDYGEFREHCYDSPSFHSPFYRNDWVTYRADTGHSPRLSNIYVYNKDLWGGVGNGNSYLIFNGFEILEGAYIESTSYIQIRNNEITQPTLEYEGLYAPYVETTSRGMELRSTTNIVIEDNEITNVYMAIYFTYPSEYVTIRNNKLHRLASDGVVFSQPSHVVIEDNHIYDIDDRRSAIAIWGTKIGSFMQDEIIIQAGTGAEGILYALGGVDTIGVLETNAIHFQPNSLGGGTVTGQTSGATMSNITKVDGAHTDGIDSDAHDPITDVIIRNNTIHGITYAGIKLARYGNATDITVENNVIYDVGGRTIQVGGVHGLSMNNNTFLDQVRFTSSNTNIIDSFYNNIIESLLLSEDYGDDYIKFVSHGNNIFGDNPNGYGGPTYPFAVDSSEIVDVNLTELFADYDNNDYRPLMSSGACNGSVNDVGVAVGALPCVADSEIQQCSDCEGIFDPCTESECHSIGDCYFNPIWFSEDCKDMGDVCDQNPVCNDVGEEECNNDVCLLDCNWDGDSCEDVVIENCTSTILNSDTFQNSLIDLQNKEFIMEFKASPTNINMDGLILLSLGAGSDFSDYAVLVRFNNQNKIDARNGGIYNADISFNYTPGIYYDFRLEVDVVNHTYNVYVDDVLLAEDYAFRTEQNTITRIDNFGMISGTGSFSICNVNFTTISSAICENDAGCSFVGNFCSGNTPYTCGLEEDGCLDRVDGIGCDVGEICFGGSCIIEVISEADYTIDEDTPVNIILNSSITGDWTRTNSPDEGTTQNKTSQNNVNFVNLTYTPDANYNGEDYFIYEVSDGMSYEVIRINITIFSVDDAPILMYENYKSITEIVFSVNETQVVKSYELLKTEYDGDNIIYSVSNLPFGAILNPKTGVLSWTVSSANIGNYENVIFTVTDNTLTSLSDTKTINITVKQAKTYYSSPSGNTETGNGSFANPWGTLQSIDEAGYFDEVRIKSGDTLKLRGGYHGKFSVWKKANTDYITIEADEGATADLSQIVLKYTDYWNFKGLRISPELAVPSRVNPGNKSSMFTGYSTRFIKIENCNMYTVDNASDWESNEWSTLAWSGIVLSYTRDGTARNNIIRNVRSGISFGSVLIENNTINGFCGDGIHVSANSILQDNIIINKHDPADGFHNDGIQGWGDMTRNMTIRRNYINARTDPGRNDSTVGGLQGMFFKGNISGRIENNVILAKNSAWGIGLSSGTHDIYIFNNTIMRPYLIGGWPNIQLSAYTIDAVVKNNIADGMPVTNITRNITSEGNLKITGYSEEEILSFFADYPHGDVRPLINSPICNGTINSIGVAVGALACVSECSVASDCPNVKCKTNKRCEGVGICVYDNLLDGTSCADDELFCTGVETCQLGSCVASGNPCTTQQLCFEPDSCMDVGYSADYEAYYRFEDNTEDEAGNYPGVVFGNPQYGEGQFGQALEFNGQDENYVETNLDGTEYDELTVLVWIKTQDISRQNSYIIDNSVWTPNGFGLIGYYDDFRFWAVNEFNTSDSAIVKVNDILELNTWIHIAAIHTRGENIVYINGVERGRNSYITEAGIEDSPDTTAIGSSHNQDGRYAWNGSIDEVMFFKRALNETEIQQIYNTQKDSGIVGSSSLSSKILNFIKSLLTTKTGNAILEGKITGNVVGGGDPNNSKRIFVGAIGFCLIIVLIIIIIKNKRFNKVKKLKKIK